MKYRIEVNSGIFCLPAADSVSSGDVRSFQAQRWLGLSEQFRAVS